MCADWCPESNLLLNRHRTEELIVDFRKRQRLTPLSKSLELRWSQVNTFKFLGSNDTREPVMVITQHHTGKGDSETGTQEGKIPVNFKMAGNISKWHGLL